MQGAVPIPKAKLDAIERMAQPVEKEIIRLSQVHRLDTSKGSQYFFYRQRGFSDVAAKYLIYKDMGLMPPHPSQVTPTGPHHVTGVQPLDIDESYFDTLPPEKKEGGVFYKNYKTAYEVGRLDRLSGETSESVATIVAYPGGADGYRDGKEGRPMKDPMTYFAIKLREMINEGKLNEEVTKSEKDDILKEVEKMVRKELNGKASKKVMNDIIKEAITNLYRTLWLRRATWLSGI